MRRWRQSRPPVYWFVREEQLGFLPPDRRNKGGRA